MPGPWTVDRNFIRAPDPESPIVPWVIAQVMNACGYEEDRSDANARLIAAAPELLEALQRLAKLTPEAANAFDAHDLHLTVCAIAETAIAKARGESA